MRVSDFDYTLPEERIAKYPPENRGATRLLVLNRSTGKVEHARYEALDAFLCSGDLLVINTTKVVRARLFALKQTGSAIELMLLEKHEGPQNHALYRGRLKKGDRLLAHGHELIVEELAGQGVARLGVDGIESVHALFERFAEVPIPPYLKRDAEALDRERYQTVFAEHPGSVAAPTASLNMTPELLLKLENAGVSTAGMTLHVGLGTFLPIRTETMEEHVMHREYYSIPARTIELIAQTRSSGGRVIALGTTVTRALEHAASRISAFSGSAPLSGEADIFIHPGYSFRTIDALLTNFHAPRSTVLMLTAAFAGADHLRAAYREAVEKRYDFLSYGDSMLIS